MASRICFISPSPESTVLYRETLSGLPDPPPIFEGAMKEAHPAALAALREGYDILVTPEHNARHIWDKIDTPIVVIPRTAVDIARAIVRAKKAYGEPLAYFDSLQPYAHMAALREILDYDVKEFFAEGLIPIVQDARGAKDLSLELGYRYSDYSTTGQWPTYKTQASWAPTSDMKVRAGFNRATRSPNVVELFTTQQLGLGGSEDLCAGANPTATVAQCELMGVPASRYGQILENPAGQYNTWGGGNPNLDPEVADTLTAGMVFTPTRLRGFTASLDYYRVKIKDTIGSLGAEDIQNQCAATGNPTLCSLIHRDRLGTLWALTDGYTITNNQNVGKLESQGVDLTATYTRGAGGMGLITFNILGSYLMNQKIDTGLYAYDCVGYFGNQCGVPTPKWRHMARVSLETRFNTTFSVGWRLIGPVTNDDGSPNEAIGDPANVQLLETNDIFKIGGQHYVDLAATYQLKKNYRLLFGVNNVFDREPPLAAGMQDNDYGTGFYGTYDPMGRYVFSGVQFTF